ncbi:carbohydrate ABC transporter permease [Sphaerochaeta halotolerans]|uniref:Sugar ABC transporter permease n=1 Tax=Sphaerochaeta halotolerans TaxID=2293840 RepID=A0A372MD32_9SPIR|nr:sugar ABC transporter permease [Sphaerochaeta halotolerans]MBG0767655.1 sugar ABC transporter permease [Spirochaetaceae bacterium]MXI87016.1 ABC transporter permease subunit [Sphaerochaeta halotolerans]RFU93707.1 sugar ABC transporter permease [Sphaerochaeta halotolerans]
MSIQGRRGIRVALPYLLPSLLGALLFAILPIIISLLLSVTNWSGMSRIRLTDGFLKFVAEHFVGLENTKAILADSEFWRALSHNLYFVVLYLPLMLVLSMICALIINAPNRGANVYRVVYYLPVLTSWVAGSLIWKWLLSPVYGPINNFLAIIGIEGPLWLQSEVWAMPSIVLASIWKDMGFYAMILLGGLKSINTEYYEAARIDGASKAQMFARITLPLLSSVLFYVSMLSMINAFQLFPQVMVMTKDGNAGPNGATMVMVERIYKYAFRYGKMGYAAAYSWILFVIIMAFTYIQKRGEKRWVNYDV